MPPGEVGTSAIGQERTGQTAGLPPPATDSGCSVQQIRLATSSMVKSRPGRGTFDEHQRAVAWGSARDPAIASTRFPGPPSNCCRRSTEMRVGEPEATEFDARLGWSRLSILTTSPVVAADHRGPAQGAILCIPAREPVRLPHGVFPATKLKVWGFACRTQR